MVLFPATCGVEKVRRHQEQAGAAELLVPAGLDYAAGWRQE